MGSSWGILTIRFLRASGLSAVDDSTLLIGSLRLLVGTDRDKRNSPIKGGRLPGDPDGKGGLPVLANEEASEEGFVLVVGDAKPVDHPGLRLPSSCVA